MKYIKLFEYFDHSKLDLPNNITSIELAKIMLDDMNVNYYNIEIIGYGQKSITYDIGFDKVLKITTSYKEWKEAYDIIGKDFKHIAKIYQVNDSILKNKYYGIIKEKVKTLPLYIEKIVNSCIYEDYPRKMELIYDGIYNADIDIWIDNHFKTDDIRSTAKQIFKQIANMIKECLENDINYEDLRGNNIGFRSIDLVFFDIGNENTI